jgi:hypothetical protein
MQFLLQLKNREDKPGDKRDAGPDECASRQFMRSSRQIAVGQRRKFEQNFSRQLARERIAEALVDPVEAGHRAFGGEAERGFACGGRTAAWASSVPM